MMQCNTCGVVIEHCENMMEAEQRGRLHMQEVPTHKAIWFLKQEGSLTQGVEDVVRNPDQQQIQDTILDDP